MYLLDPSFGRLVAERRKVAGIIRVQITEAFNTSQQTMAFYEGGVPSIPVDVLTQ